MSKLPRKFRSDVSLNAEVIAREAVLPLLVAHGFSDVTDRRIKHGATESQIVSARNLEGKIINMRVRLCWRRGGRSPNEQNFSAAQLRNKLIDDNWEKTLDYISNRDISNGNDYNMIAQYDVDNFILAALIPTDLIPEIWQKQRKISEDLIRDGRAGRRAKNHTMNGTSPTIWLQDDRVPGAHLVADALWSYPGVIDIFKYQKISEADYAYNDTYNDISIDYNALGRDEGKKFTQVRSGFPRDPKVREFVLRRADGSCEMSGCGASRSFAGFLDVHHILGIGGSDRPWSCVALCPNCHREAHFSPKRDAINVALGEYAAKFRNI